MMNHIALRRFTNTPAGTEQTTHYEVGDLVPGFESWPEHARISLIRQNYVQPQFAAPVVVATPVVVESDGEDAASASGKRTSRRK